MLNHRNRTEPLARFGILFCSFHSLTAYSSFSFSFSLSAHGTTKKFPISGYRFLPWKTSNVKSPTGVWTFSTIYIIFDIVIFPLSNPNAFVFTFDVLVWSEFSIFFFSFHSDCELKISTKYAFFPLTSSLFSIFLFFLGIRFLALDKNVDSIA